MHVINVTKALKRLSKIDPFLDNYHSDIRMHLERYNEKLSLLCDGKSLSEVANGYMYFGLNRCEGGWTFREWLPAADEAWLIGDVNGWQKTHPLNKTAGGVFEIYIEGDDTIKHGECIKLLVRRGNECFERIPAYIKSTVMDERNWRLCGRVWSPKTPFKWTDDGWRASKKVTRPLIYEAHVGMAQDKLGVGSFREFADLTLPRIKRAGYNTVQLMAIAEHPYYASFGYQVTNFFAPSYRFGTPDDLKYLIDRAHSLGIAVTLDVVHSHACPNISEGLNMQDGTEDQYFLAGERGMHSAWGTRVFDYGKPEVLHFLLSNIKYWQEEFHFDGFRFDGVTSMLYENHGLGVAFTDYSQYYSLNTNVDARVYLMLANELIHELNKNAITVAEDMSGMPGMCLPISSAGFGFDYRLAMGIPDMWIKLIKEIPIENWDLGYIWYELTTGRKKEKTIGYAESHDQAMVGDKTIIFRLADAEMYTGMCKDYHTPTMDTAIDMHKLIRLLTLSLAKNGYLNFMGNEFGHPEWIDFPREGNGWSYAYARRQWSLADSHGYKYEWLAEFDRAMIAHVKAERILSDGDPKPIFIDQGKNVLIFTRGGLIYAFNLNPTRSDDGVFISCAELGEGDYKVVLSSDDGKFGGLDRISKDVTYKAMDSAWGLGFKLYIPCRCAVVLKKVK